jgi:RHS repeat-associated protein
MGSTVALTDVSGNLQTQYTYGPFGNTVVSGAANDNPYEYGGREADPLTGMYYLRGRFLDSGLSRFVSRDSAGFQGGGHLYNYAGNAPIDFKDPTGKCDLPGAFAGALLGVAGAAGTSGANGWALAAGGIGASPVTSAHRPYT